MPANLDSLSSLDDRLLGTLERLLATWAVEHGLYRSEWSDA